MIRSPSAAPEVETTSSRLCGARPSVSEYGANCAVFQGCASSTTPSAVLTGTEMSGTTVTSRASSLRTVSAVEENSLGKRLIGVLLDLECLRRADHGVCTGVEMW